VQIDGRDYRLVDMIAYFADPAEHEFILSTPYLIPVGDFLKVIKEEVAEGLRVRILTNSLSSTNHTLVNSHYNKYRLPILETGVELLEFRHQPSAGMRALADVEPIEAPFVSLHAKVLVSDRRRCFIGSLNFDPRALIINSENGLLIESPALAEKLTDILEEMMASRNAWKLALKEDNSIVWKSGDTILTGQPSRGFFQSITDFLGRLLPIEGQL
jgi:putative cardiolipin synthase